MMWIELFVLCTVALIVTGCIYVAGNMVSNLEERN
jgi:hypothetical protein